MTEKTYEPAATRKAQIMEIIERFEWGRQEVPFSEVDVWADSNYPISEIDQWICAGVWKNTVAQKLEEAGLAPEDVGRNGYLANGDVLVLKPGYDYWADYGWSVNVELLGRTLSELPEEKDITPLIESLVEWRDDPRNATIKQLAALRDEAAESAHIAKEGVDSNVHLLGEGLTFRENETFEVAKTEINRIAFFTASSAAYEISCKRLANLRADADREDVSKNLQSTANMLKMHASRDPQKPDPGSDGILAASQNVRHLASQVCPASENYEQLESSAQYRSPVAAAAQAKPAIQAVWQNKATESRQTNSGTPWQFADRER